MKTTSITLATGLAAVLFTLPAAADQQKAGAASQEAMQKSGAMSEANFGKIDTDSDGYLSKREVQAQSDLSTGQPNLIDQWDSVDKNKDNQLDRAEFSAFETMGQGKEKHEGASGAMDKEKGRM